MITIADCPFCGHPHVEIEEVGAGEYAVCCPECKCTGPTNIWLMDCIKEWNKAGPATARYALTLDQITALADALAAADGHIDVSSARDKRLIESAHATLETAMGQDAHLVYFPAEATP